MSVSKFISTWTALSDRPSFNLQQMAGRARKIAPVMLLLLGMLTGLQSFATSIVYKSFDDLVKEADGVVAGRVANIESQYNAKHEIYTFVTLDQLTVLSGSYSGQSLTLRFKGGQIENTISKLVGSPEFNLNDQVVLFVEGNGHYMVPVVGWTQGVFRVSQDPTTGRAVIQDHEGNRVLGIKAGAVMKEMNVEPAAHIVGKQSAIVSTASQSSGDGGSADNNSQRASSLNQTATTVSDAPTMTSEAFFATIKNAAAVKTSPGELKSLTVGDFSLPSNGNVDSSIGPKAAATDVPQSQSPAQPQRRPVPQSQDRN